MIGIMGMRPLGAQPGSLAGCRHRMQIAPVSRRVALMLRYFLAALLLIGVGCKESNTRARTPASLQVVSGDAQQGDAGVALPGPVAVRVLDADGRTMPDQEVSFAVLAGKGTATPAYVSTDANGVAQTRWTLGPVAGAEQTLVASVGSSPIVQQFHATARAGAAHALARLTPPIGTVYSGAVIPPIEIQVVDAFQNPVHQGGVAVDVGVDRMSSFASRILGVTTATTDANGIAKFSDLVIRTVARTPLPPTGFTFRADGLEPLADAAQTQYGPPASISGSDPMTGLPGFTFYPTFTLSDAWGNGLEGVPLDVTYPQPDGTPTSARLTTEFPGTVQLRMLLTAVGSYAVTATSPTVPNKSATVSITVLPNPPGAPEHIVVVSGNGASAPAGSTLPPLVVQVTDKNGTPVPNVDVEWNVASGIGFLSSVSTTTDSSGLTSVTLTLASTPGPVVVRATIGGIAVLITTTFSLTGT